MKLNKTWRVTENTRSLRLSLPSRLGVGVLLCALSLANGCLDTDEGVRVRIEDEGSVPAPEDGGMEMPEPAEDAGPMTPEPTELENFTFLVWSDLHANGEDTFHLDPVMAANALPGTTLPPELGGNVEAPDFILDCGDSVEWPSHAAVEDYEQAILEVSTYEVRPVLGNHDLTSTSTSPVMENFFLEHFTDVETRYDYNDEGSSVDERSYRFEHKGVAFIGLSHTYSTESDSPAQPVGAGDRAWLMTQLEAVGTEMPVVIWLHMGVESLTNADELASLFSDYNVVLVAGGHYHNAAHREIQGIPFVQIGSPKPGDGAEPTFLVARVQDGIFGLAQYNFQTQTFDATETLIYALGDE